MCLPYVKIEDRNVFPQAVHVVDADNQPREIPYGAVIWASGLGQVELAKRLIAKVEEQKGSRLALPNSFIASRHESPYCTFPAHTHTCQAYRVNTLPAKALLRFVVRSFCCRMLKVRPDLTLMGTENIYAIGDCARVTPPFLKDKADELFDVSSGTR